jgi:hypothetical protein
MICQKERFIKYKTASFYKRKPFTNLKKTTLNWIVQVHLQRHKNCSSIFANKGFWFTLLSTNEGLWRGSLACEDMNRRYEYTQSKINALTMNYIVYTPLVISYCNRKKEIVMDQIRAGT